MPTINQLPSIDEVSGGNQIPTYYAGGGDARKMSVNLLQEYMQDNLNFPDNASEVTYNPAGTGAVARTVEAKLRDVVSVKDFGAVGNGVADDTGAIQAAINTGSGVFFPDGTYKCSGLTQSTNGQRLFANGKVILQKNANGVILTCSGTEVELNGLMFYGDASTPTFTGNNVNASGNNFRMVNCGSRWAYARAVKSTGGHTQIIGTCDIYQTTDATASGYDIEIGVSGTATFYHQLFGVYTSQSSGGILFTDTGSHVISGGQFGKLTIQSGTSPAGVNGGITSNARILGNVTVGLSSAVFVGNQFSAIAFSFSAGTSGCRLDMSNVFASGATVVNSGNTNNLIERETSAGSVNVLRYGPDANYRELTLNLLDATLAYEFDGSCVLPNTRAYRIKNAAGTVLSAVALSSGNDWTIGADSGAGNFMNIVSGDGGIYLGPGNVSSFQAVASSFRPQTDAIPNLGTASQRWNTVYAATGTINTSDEREKQDISALDDAERRVAVAIKGLVKKFRFKDAVQKKGDGARIHVGVIVQEVMAAFQVEGLDPMRYGIICYDQWQESPEVLADDGTLISPLVPAGDRYGVRYEELLAFIIATL